MLEVRPQVRLVLDADGQPDQPIRDAAAYRKFLEDIGYLVPHPKGAKATTTNVDAELALQAGPQLVVPIKKSPRKKNSSPKPAAPTRALATTRCAAPR